MGHIVAKASYRALRERLDKNSVGAPDSPVIYEILKLVFSEEEARVGAEMPFAFEPLDVVARRLGRSRRELEPILAGMADKGLVFDLRFGDEKLYTLAPTMVGFFEFSMMRLRDDIDQKKLAGLLHHFVMEDPTFYKSTTDLQTPPLRVVPHETSLPDSGTYAQILDYERASLMVGSAPRWALSMCYCRHVAHHLKKDCKKFRMESSCMSMGKGADWAIEHGLAEEISRQQALELLDEAREAGLVHTLENVQNDPSYMCNCCGCCCELLGSFKKFKPFDPTFSSDFIAAIDESRCNGCGKCVKACPVSMIDLLPSDHVVGGKKMKRLARVIEDGCLGCGVCHAACKFDGLHLKRRAVRRITPENTFKRVLMSALETGKLHHFLADEAEGMPWFAANRLLQAMLTLPPAKQVLLRDVVKSRFVDTLAAAAKMGGMETDL